MRRFGLALIGLCTIAVHAANGAGIKGGQSITVTSEPAGFSRIQPSKIKFGKLLWRGGIVLESADRRFGGFSGLEISADGKQIVAVSDHGWWLSASLQHDAGNLTGLSAAQMAPILSKSGNRSGKKSKRDAEALAAFDGRRTDGPLIVGYERRERVEFFDLPADGFKATPSRIKSPKAISSGPKNGELESVLHIWEGRRTGWYLAISEKNLDQAGNIRGWLWKGSKTVEFAIVRNENFRITDVALLPGANEIVTLERSFSRTSPPGLALRRFNLNDLKPGQPANGTKLLQVHQPFFAIDNMEGLAVHQTKAGETRLTMISDDNYNRTLQSTLLLQFALPK